MGRQDLSPLRKAVLMSDWPAVSGHFGRYPAPGIVMEALGR